VRAFLFLLYSRVRSYCRDAYDLARVTGRATHNPLEGLQKYLQSGKTENYDHVSPDELPGLIRAIAAYPHAHDMRLGLRLLSLFAVRPSELREAQWSEFDFAKKLWAIPVERKGRKKVLSTLFRFRLRRSRSWRSCASTSAAIPVYSLAAATTAEAVKALCVQIPGFERFLSNAKSRGLEFAVLRDKRNIGEKELNYNGTGDMGAQANQIGLSYPIGSALIQGFVPETRSYRDRSC